MADTYVLCFVYRPTIRSPNGKHASYFALLASLSLLSMHGHLSGEQEFSCSAQALHLCVGVICPSPPHPHVHLALEEMRCSILSSCHSLPRTPTHAHNDSLSEDNERTDESPKPKILMKIWHLTNCHLLCTLL